MTCDIPYPNDPFLVCCKERGHEGAHQSGQTAWSASLKMPKAQIEAAMREWSMRRGGFSHDAATITAAIIAKAEKKDPLPDFLSLHASITKAMMEEAEKEETAYKAKLEGKPEQKKEEPDHTEESAWPSQRKPAKEASE